MKKIIMIIAVVLVSVVAVFGQNAAKLLVKSEISNKEFFGNENKFSSDEGNFFEKEDFDDEEKFFDDKEVTTPGKMVLWITGILPEGSVRWCYEKRGKFIPVTRNKLSKYKVLFNGKVQKTVEIMGEENEYLLDVKTGEKYVLVN